MQSVNSGPPAQTTPARRPCSIRRTTTHDCSRSHGFSGPVEVTARGRDLLTLDGGDSRVLDAARLEVLAQYIEQRISRIVAEPSDPRISSLVGTAAFAGFRRAVGAALPGEATTGSIRFQLLDDLPGVLLVSGRAIRAAGFPIEMRGKVESRLDICAGWVTGGTAHAGWTAGDGPPYHPGPIAPELEVEQDRLAWHEGPAATPHGTRRRLDVWEEGGLGMVDCFFRDSHVDVGGVETVVHEYSVRATFDPGTLTIISCDAAPGPLPYGECPTAVASAGRIAGLALGGLRRAVRHDFVGPSTCSHLNDTLRSLEDVGALLRALEAGRMPAH